LKGLRIAIGKLFLILNFFDYHYKSYKDESDELVEFILLKLLKIFFKHTG